MENLPFCSAGTLAEAIREGRIGSREALELYLERVERLNPALNAVIALNPEAARERADEADVALSRGEVWGPLHGVPLTIKDSYEVVGMTTVCGAPWLKNHRPETNAVAVQRLVDAGAVIFGKTNVPLMTQDIQTFNSVFGTTNNPWNTAHTPGGSSGGAAAAVAAGLNAFELGSDIGGSIRTPAHFCGIYSHRPSHGVVSMRGHIPGPPGTVSESDLAVAGPLARDPADLELALDVLAGSAFPADKGWRVKLPAARHDKLSDFRAGCWFDDAFCPVDSATREALEQVAQTLRNTGARVEASVQVPTGLEAAMDNYEGLLNAVLGAGLPDKLYRKFQRMAPLMRLLKRDGTGQLGRFMNTAIQTHRQWARLNEARQRVRLKWEAFFQDYDVLLMPVTLRPAIEHDQEGNVYTRHIHVDGQSRRYFEQFVWIAPATAALLPVTVAPLQRSPEGLPIGMQIVGPFLEDRTTIAFARLLADEIGGFTPPPDYAN